MACEGMPYVGHVLRNMQPPDLDTVSPASGPHPVSHSPIRSRCIYSLTFSLPFVHFLHGKLRVISSDLLCSARPLVSLDSCLFQFFFFACLYFVLFSLDFS